MTSLLLLSCLCLLVVRIVEVTERFTYLGSDIHVSAGSEPEVNQRLGRAWGVVNSLDHEAWRCRYLCNKMKV